MKYTFKDFLAGKVDVRCKNKEQKKAFLKVCAKHGLLWQTSTKADEFIPLNDIITMKGFNNGRLGQSALQFADACVGFDEIDLSPAPCYQIIIESDGDTTAAKMTVNGKEVKQVTAKRNPADKANWRTGAQVAFDRLWAKQEKPEKPAEKGGFKVWDRVVCVGEDDNRAVAGKHGTVVCVKEFDCIGIKFDECVDGHSLETAHLPFAIKNGHGWWCSGKNLRHEQPIKQKVREAKPGEYIKLTEKIYSFDKVGMILQVDEGLGWCVLVSQRNHPTSPYDDDQNFTWAYPNRSYVVLEGYKP